MAGRESNNGPGQMSQPVSRARYSTQRNSKNVLCCKIRKSSKIDEDMSKGTKTNLKGHPVANSEKFHYQKNIYNLIE